MTRYRYVVLGSGRQGTAAAYDLALRGDALGRLEAFCASGTGSTFPWTYRGKLPRFTSRIVRYPGHLAAIRTLKELGDAAMMAKGQIASGVAVRELSVDPEQYVNELERRECRLPDG